MKSCLHSDYYYGILIMEQVSRNELFWFPKYLFKGSGTSNTACGRGRFNSFAAKVDPVLLPPRASLDTRGTKSKSKSS